MHQNIEYYVIGENLPARRVSKKRKEKRDRPKNFLRFPYCKKNLLYCKKKFPYWKIGIRNSPKSPFNV
jgi:hypothetical protein